MDFVSGGTGCASNQAAGLGARRCSSSTARARPFCSSTTPASPTAKPWTCDKYDGNTNGQKTIELCTVDPKVLGFGLQDFGVTKDFADFFGKLLPGGAAQTFRIGSLEEQGYSGVPVRSIVTANGQTITSELTDVKRQAFPDALFQAPAGYAKTVSPFGRGRSGGGQ